MDWCCGNSYAPPEKARRARAVGVIMDIYPFVADRIRRDPAAIDEALRVLDRWDARDVGPKPRRDEWRRLLLSAKMGPRGHEALMALLLDTSEAARRLKDFAPFAGVLSREERRQAFLSCSYDH
ncbi:hypothetical protein ACFLSJ_06160 [Verrucomicrobiota bacterium]